MKKPSVSELCDLLAKPALIAWANKQGLAGIDIKVSRKAAKSAGTSYHLQIERGVFDDPLVAGNFTRFAQDKELIATEKQIETEWFTGRYDVLLGYRGERWICDYKKSRRHRIWLEHKIQLVAYGMAEPVDRFAVVAVPDFAFIPLDISRDQREKIERMVICLSQLWTLKQEIDV